MPQDVPIPLTGDFETYDWISTHGLSELVANFARVHILVSLFDGDPEKWLDFLAKEGTDEERNLDQPFVEEMARRLSADPTLLGEMRRLVREFSQLFARPSSTS